MEKITISEARAKDIEGIARVFTECFIDSVLHHCGGKLPKPIAMQDVFSLVYQAEPAAALVAKDTAGKVVGYCFAPTGLQNLWVRAILGGHIMKWAWRWLSGQYGFGLHPVKVIVLNKIAFLRSSISPKLAANARILSIAVDENLRGRGIATSLMLAADQYFCKQQVARVRLEVRPDNKPAIRVYEKQGYYPNGYTHDSQGPWLIMFKDYLEVEFEKHV